MKSEIKAVFVSQSKLKSEHDLPVPIR